MYLNVNLNQTLTNIGPKWSEPIVTKNITVIVLICLVLALLITIIVYFKCIKMVTTNRFDTQAFVEQFSSLKQPIEPNQIFKDKKEKFNMITKQFQMDQSKLFEYANNCLNK